ncbi:MAG: SCO family protein [Gammaproteobacteria bacterium]|jgi:protein SCO1/2
MRFSILLCSLLLLSIYLNGSSAAARAEQKPVAATDAKQVFDYDMALKISQGAIDNQVGNYAFTNADGERVTLSDFRGKPMVISMIYTSCYQICPMTTRHLSKVVEKARDALGDDSFSVAVIGFDTQFDTPEAMQYFANKQGISNRNWNLLSMAEEDVDALSKDIGFIYYPSSNGFDHLIQATIIDADGKVYRQVYGQAFDTPLLVDPLIELVLGRPQPAQSFISSLGSKIRLFCTTYDPVRDGYYFDYSLFLGMLIGGSIIIYTVVVLVRERRKSGRHYDA